MVIEQLQSLRTDMRINPAANDPSSYRASLSNKVSLNTILNCKAKDDQLKMSGGFSLFPIRSCAPRLCSDIPWSCSFLKYVSLLSNQTFHYACSIMPKRVTSLQAHPRVIASGQHCVRL